LFSCGFFLQSKKKKQNITRKRIRVKSFTTNTVFFTHAIWLDQAFAHCPKFLTAAARKRLGRVSVPVWLIILLDQLRIFGLGGFYPANYLILRKLIPQRLYDFIHYSFNDFIQDSDEIFS
jgi:hypothetical protein